MIVESIPFEVIKEKASSFMQYEGNSKGLSVVPDLEYVQFREGELVLKNISDIAAQIGYPFDYTAIPKYDWFPEKYTALLYTILEYAHGWSEDDFYQTGYAAPSISYIVKIAMKFTNLETALTQAPKIFTSHYDFGFMTYEDIDIPNKKLTVVLNEFPFGYVERDLFRGYFAKIIEIFEQPKSLTVGYTQCENHCHKFPLTWQ